MAQRKILLGSDGEDVVKSAMPDLQRFCTSQQGM
jgi:hypothetical protein